MLGFYASATACGSYTAASVLGASSQTTQNELRVGSRAGKHLVTEALRSYSEAVQTMPASARALTGLSIALAESGQSSTAAKVLTAAVRASGSGRALGPLGLLLLRHGNPEVAQQVLQEAQAVDPNNIAMWAGQAAVAEQRLEHLMLGTARSDATPSPSASQPQPTPVEGLVIARGLANQAAAAALASADSGMPAASCAVAAMLALGIGSAVREPSEAGASVTVGAVASSSLR